MNSKGGGVGILVCSSFLDHEGTLPTTNTHDVPHTTSQSNVASEQALEPSIEVDYLSNKEVTRYATQPMSLQWQCWLQHSETKPPSSGAKLDRQFIWA